MGMHKIFCPAFRSGKGSLVNVIFYPHKNPIWFSTKTEAREIDWQHADFPQRLTKCLLFLYFLGSNAGYNIVKKIDTVHNLNKLSI